MSMGAFGYHKILLGNRNVVGAGGGDEVGLVRSFCSYSHINISTVMMINGEEKEDEHWNHGYDDLPLRDSHRTHEFGDDDEDDLNDEKPLQTTERALYWESQQSLLEEILDQYSSNGLKLRKEIMKQIAIARETSFCDCLQPKSDTKCIRCLRQKVVDLLCSKGLSVTLCKSQWKHTGKIPGGKHEYIELIASTQGRKKQIRFVIELEFQDQFKMAKACDEYQKLINQLPEVYIGKAEHLNAIIRIACDAAKRSTTENKVHLGPWRKRSFMQMKWSASRHERMVRPDEHQSSSSKLRLISSAEQQPLAGLDLGLIYPTGTAVKVA